MRRPNTKCATCDNPLYQRPGEIAKGRKIYCDEVCRNAPNSPCTRKSALAICAYCSNKFHRRNKRSKCCSRSCAASRTRGPRKGKYIATCRTAPAIRLQELHDKFNFNSCMVIGCDYDVCLEVHRVISGTLGGQYEIGNMFAVCPNHHAEHTRKFRQLVKVDDQTLDSRQLETQPPC